MTNEDRLAEIDAAYARYDMLSPNRSKWLIGRVKALTAERPTSQDDETVIQRAIDEWATIQGGPRPTEFTLAHYIVTSLHDHRYGDA